MSTARILSTKTSKDKGLDLISIKSHQIVQNSKFTASFPRISRIQDIRTTLFNIPIDSAQWALQNALTHYSTACSWKIFVFFFKSQKSIPCLASCQIETTQSNNLFSTGPSPTRSQLQNAPKISLPILSRKVKQNTPNSSATWNTIIRPASMLVASWKPPLQEKKA